ncbi:hypothetical protein [Chryseobacterium jejuense]|uniref:hypothetical protein n=1 Tax=Chryseobacterium jejuense TaxID=445960 RepID=UPI001AE2DD25|nr:hypothetical protein [Chryseobacterium jejuense]MBP2616008.1 hypothetical protein [Chryseobacterium jejuense]
MPSNIENTVGLQGCYWKVNGQTFEPKKGGTYVLYTKDTNEFFVDETCVGGKSKNPKHTVANARWAFIYDIFFQSFKNAEQKDITTNLWGPLSGGTEVVSKYALGTNYKVGNSIAFNPQGDVYYYGYKQRIELFSDSPGTGFYFYIVPVNKPLINFAYFNKSEELRHYGETANLTVMFHGFNFDEKNRYKARVFLFENTGKEAALTETGDFEDLNLWENIIIKELEQYESDSNHNIYLRHNFNINIDWKKGENKKKDFTIAVEVLKTPKDKKREDWKRVDFKNFAKEPTTDLVNYDSKLLKLQDVDKKNSISSRFMVSEELMDQYLERIEKEKNNMIQYIGDIEYKQREFDPCGYSKITVKDEDDKERDPLVIFDEMAAVGSIDKTEQSFAIITGDTRKNISITLDKLTTQDTFCQGLLLEDGQKHSEKKNVFQVDKVYAALKNGATHVRQADATHHEQQKGAGVATTKENENDTDVVKTNNVYEVSGVQQWKEGTDYKIDSNEKITLMLKYLYNRTALEDTQKKYLGPKNNGLVNTLWLFRYFILSDDLAQTFFLPVSTCRYPNQLVKVKVYPDIEWELAFLITIGAGYSNKLRFERTRLNAYHRGYNFRYLRDELNVEVKETANLGWSIAGKCVENGNEHSLGFDGIKRTVELLVSGFNASLEVLNILNPDGTNPADSAAVSKKIIEIDFAIDPPNIGFALSKKFGEATTKEIVPIYKGGFRADPLIGITISVDMVPIIGKAGLIGKIIDWIIFAVETLTSSEVYITFEAGLAVKFDFTLSYNRVDGLDSRSHGEQVVTVEVPISVKAGCKSDDVITIAAVTRGGRTYPEQKLEKWKVEGQLSTTFTFTKTYGYDKEKSKQYETSKGVWNPAEITITCYMITASKITGQPKKSEKFKLFDEKTLFENPKNYTDE